AAEIVGIDTEAADALLEDARGQMMRQEPTSVLIIEDEPVIALSLADLVRSAGHEVVGMAATREEAVAMAQETRPGLVLADIRLQDDSSGVD
ncbi:response regulator, partial [Klebsiella pneumoniae]